jgi:hypothetical protein
MDLLLTQSDTPLWRTCKAQSIHHQLSFGFHHYSVFITFQQQLCKHTWGRCEAVNLCHW